MAQNEKNSWDHANRQGENQSFNTNESEDKYLKDDVERNPNYDADGYGAEAAREDHHDLSAGFAGRSGNNHEPHNSGSRNYENGTSRNQGSSGRAS